MRITLDSPEVLALKKIWDSAEVQTPGKGEVLGNRLVQEVLVPAIRKFEGELILRYHEFLNKVPSGCHSIPHGTEMVTRTTYRTTVARLACCEIELVQGREGFMSPFRSPSKALATVLWGTDLEARYRSGDALPYFAFKHNGKSNENKLDLSLLGHHLFTMRKAEFDWATRIQIVIGNESVRTWLMERNSPTVFGALMQM